MAGRMTDRDHFVGNMGAVDRLPDTFPELVEAAGIPGHKVGMQFLVVVGKAVDRDLAAGQGVDNMVAVEAVDSCCPSFLALQTRVRGWQLAPGQLLCPRLSARGCV